MKVHNLATLRAECGAFMDTGSYRAEHRRIDDAGNAWIWRVRFAPIRAELRNDVLAWDVTVPGTPAPPRGAVSTRCRATSNGRHREEE